MTFAEFQQSLVITSSVLLIMSEEKDDIGIILRTAVPDIFRSIDSTVDSFI